MFKTRWHRVQEAVALGNVFMSTAKSEAEHLEELKPGVLNKTAFVAALDLFNSAPKFYYEADCMAALYDRPDQVHRSLAAMADVGVARLPFPYLLAEYDWGGPTLVCFSESKKDKDCPFRSTAMQLMNVHGQDAVCLSPLTFYTSPVYTEDDGINHGMRWKVFLAGWCNGTPEAKRYADQTVDYWKPMVEPGLIATMLLLNTRGLVKEVVEAPEPLNRSRAKKNRPPIPTHTVIRIGHYYNRVGTRVEHRQGTGIKQPLHLRAGYTAARWITRRHPDWKAELANDEGRHTILVMVDPYIVNYDPAHPEEVPEIPERRIKW